MLGAVPGGSWGRLAPQRNPRRRLGVDLGGGPKKNQENPKTKCPVPGRGTAPNRRQKSVKSLCQDAVKDRILFLGASYLGLGRFFIDFGSILKRFFYGFGYGFEEWRSGENVKNTLVFNDF